MKLNDIWLLDSRTLIFTFSHFVIILYSNLKRRHLVGSTKPGITPYFPFSTLLWTALVSVLSRENNCEGRHLGEKLTFLLNGENLLDMKFTIINLIWVCYRLSYPVLEISLGWWWLHHHFWSQLWAWWKGTRQKLKFLRKTKVNWSI